MYCYNCGNKLEEKYNYCPKCGAKQTTNDDTYEKIKDYVISTGKTGIAFISKELDIAKDKVKEAIDKLEKEGIVSPLKGNRREVTNTTELVKIEEPKEKLSDKSIILALTSYLGILAFVPYFFNKDNDEYVKFHAKEGMNLLIVWVIYSVLSYLLGLIKISKRISLLNGMVGVKMVSPIWISIPVTLVGIVIFIINVIGIYYALVEEKKELPLINKFKIIK